MFTFITIGDQSRILTRDRRNPGAFRSFVMACPVMYERQVLRLGPVNGYRMATVQRKAKQERQGPGPVDRDLVSRSRLSQITSCHLGSAGLAPTRRSGENTRVNILSFETPQNLRGPSSPANLPGQISLGYSSPRESRDADPAFQKSALMMQISRGPGCDG